MKDKDRKTRGRIFSIRLDKVLKMRDINQSDLAAAIGVQRQTVSNYVRGQSFPDVVTLTAIARHLRVSTDYLCGLSESGSFNISIREICDRTGLTDDTISALLDLQKKKREQPEIEKFRFNFMINEIICVLCKRYDTRLTLFIWHIVNDAERTTRLYREREKQRSKWKEKGNV